MTETGKRVLVVDDDAEIQLVLAMVLKKAGFVTLQAKTGAEGLEVMRREKPDLLLLDVLMPEMDGWAVVQAKNREPAIAGIPTIILTASGQMIDRTMAEHLAKARAFLTKPFEPAELIAEVRKALGMGDSGGPGGR